MAESEMVAEYLAGVVRVKDRLFSNYKTPCTV